MTKYVLDTNLYIRAFRDPAAAVDLKQFVAANTPRIYLHSVVASELLAGAVTAQLKRDLDRQLISPFERRGRVLTPSHLSWKTGANLIAELISQKRLTPNGISRSFPNDCLIAASAAEFGFSLITSNLADFHLIAEVCPVRFQAPWPADS